MKCDLSWLNGQTLEGVMYREPDNWWFHFSNGAIVHTETAWRIIASGSIVRCSRDHGQWFGLSAPVDAEAEAQKLLIGLVVESAEVRDDTLDVVVCFATGVRLEILPNSSGYESWRIQLPNGDEISALGGGELVLRKN